MTNKKNVGATSQNNMSGQGIFRVFGGQGVGREGLVKFSSTRVPLSASHKDWAELAQAGHSPGAEGWGYPALTGWGSALATCMARSQLLCLHTLSSQPPVSWWSRRSHLSSCKP